MTLGVDVSSAVNSTAWACLAAASVEWTATRAWHSYGAFDNTSIANLKGAAAAGIPSNDVYLFPCPTQDAQQQASDMLSMLGSEFSGKVWIDVENNPSKGCSWTALPAGSGCAFLREMVAVIQEQQGTTPGIYANHNGWSSTVGLDCQLQGEYSLSLWYAHYDKDGSSCSDFTPFGGWDTPSMKQFTDKPSTPELAACGINADTSTSC